MKRLPTSQNSEIVHLINKKYPPRVIRRWCEIANSSLVKISSHNPWIIAERLAAEFDIKISLKLTNYTQGSDSTRWYTATYSVLK